MDEALAKLEREVERDPSDEGLLRRLLAAKQRAGWAYAGHGLDHWVAQLSLHDDERDPRTGPAFASFGVAAAPALADGLEAGAWRGASVVLSELGRPAWGVVAPALRRLASSAQGYERQVVHALLLSSFGSHEPFDIKVDLFVRTLTDPDEDIRLRALHCVASYDPTPTSAIPHLLGLLKDADPLMQRWAAQLLARTVDPRVRPEEVTSVLLSVDWSGAERARPIFETVAGQDAVPAFLDATSLPDPAVRRHAIQLLSVLQLGVHREAVASRFIEALGDEDPSVRESAIGGLEHLAREGAHITPVVLAALDDPVPDRRAAAASVLSSVGDASVAGTALTRALHDDDERVRRAAMTALGARGADARRALPWLAAFLDDAPETVFTAWTAMNLIGAGADQLPLVERLLRSEHACYVGVSLLTVLGPPGASLAPILVELLDRESRPAERRLLADALLAVGRSLEVALPTRIPDGEPFDAYNDGTFALGVRLASLSRDDPTVVPALAGLLEHESRTTRVVAAHVLALAGVDELTLPTLLELLAGSPDPNDRARAACALGALRRSTPAVTAALTRALEDDHMNVSEAAADSLQRLSATATDDP